MASRLYRAFASRKNLVLAYRRLLTAQNPQYKIYFREAYLSYGLALSENVRLLSRHLRTGTYDPSPPRKIFLPKASGLQRPYSLMLLEDQIVYQAIANIFAEKIRSYLDRTALKRAFGHILGTPGDEFFFRPWQVCYRRFANRIVKNWNDGFVWAAEFDLAAFYDTISHKLLIDALCPKGGSEDLTRLLKKCLTIWTMSDLRLDYEHGIPQGPQASDFFAEAFLCNFDMKSPCPGYVRYIRYVDDIKVMAREERWLIKALVELDERAKGIGLIPQSAKVVRHRITDPFKETKTVPYGFTLPADIIGNTPAQQRDLCKTFFVSLTLRKDRIDDQTQCKFALYRLDPDEIVLKAVLRLFPRYPELYAAFCVFLGRFGKRRKIANAAMRYILAAPPYGIVEASIWELLMSTASAKAITSSIPTARKRITKRANPCFALKASILKLLTYSMPEARKQYPRILNIDDPLLLIQIIVYYCDSLDKTKRDQLINFAMSNNEAGLASLAAKLFIDYDCTLTCQVRDISPTAQEILRKFGKIGQIRYRFEPIEEILKNRFGLAKPFNWRQAMSKHYAAALQQLLLAESAFDKDPSAWISYMDGFNDLLTVALFDHKPALVWKSGRPPRDISFGKYLYHTNLNSVYSKIHGELIDIHDRRNTVPTSHPIQKRTQSINKPLKPKDKSRWVNAMRKLYSEIVKIW